MSMVIFQKGNIAGGDPGAYFMYDRDTDAAFGPAGSTQAAFRLLSTAVETTVDVWKAGVDDTCNRLVVCSYGRIATDTGLAAASHPTLSVQADAANKFLHFYQDGTDSFVESSDGILTLDAPGGIDLKDSGASVFTVVTGALIGAAGSSPRINNTTGISGTVQFCMNKSDADTGVGWGGTNIGELIAENDWRLRWRGPTAGGAASVTIRSDAASGKSCLEFDQDDTDDSVFYFTCTVGSGNTIDNRTTPGTLTHWIKCELDGVGDKWIPLHDSPS